MPSAADYARARRHMVDTQLAGRGITSQSVLDAMREVPRERFVEEGYEELAYEDGPLPIGEGQTISQPYVVGLMIEAAQTGPGGQVLEVGSGSGYASAVISRIARHVYAIERHPSLAAAARRRFLQLGYDNIEVHVGDGSLGWPEALAFEAILVSAGGPDVPDALKRQLAIGGRLVIPVGTQERRQMLLRVTRRDEDSFEEEPMGEVMFVPLIGAQAWPAGQAEPD